MQFNRLSNHSFIFPNSRASNNARTFPSELISFYQMIEKIGEGGYGQVWKAIHLQTKTIVAIKVFRNLFQDCVDAKRILREIYILRRLDHPNIIKVRDFIIYDCDSIQEAYLVLDYCSYDLKYVLNQVKFLSKEVIVKVIFQLLKTLDYLKKKNILHRDIKPPNILVDQYFNVKLCDFGVARNIKSIKIVNKNIEEYRLFENNNLIDITNYQLNNIPIQRNSFLKNYEKSFTHRIGSRWYRPPEIILINKKYDEKFDIWSLGCVFAEMLGKLKDDSLKGPLFPGNSCYPISPIYQQKKDIYGNELNEKVLGIEITDQLNVILDIIGSPDINQLDFIENESAKEYVKNFPKKRKTKFEKLYPGADKDLLFILENMLIFNPNNRIHTSELLKLEIFKKFTEDFDLQNSENNIGKEILIDFETNKFHLDHKDLKLLFLREASYFNKNIISSNSKTLQNLDDLLKLLKQ